MLNLYIKHYPVTARMPNFDFMKGFQKDARRVKRGCESINSTEAEEHNSFDHSKASTTTCDYRTEREKPSGTLPSLGPEC